MPPLLVLLLASAAPASSLAEDGLRAYEEMDLDAAHALLTKAQRAAPSRERPRVELWLGIVELERGNEPAARRWLRSALQTSPGLAVPSSVSPKVRALLDELRPVTRTARPARVVSRARPEREVAPSPALPPAPANALVLPSAPAAEAAPVDVVVVASLTSPASPPLTATSPPAAAPAPAATSAGDSVAGATATVFGDVQLPSPLVLAGAGAGALAVGAIGGGAILGALAQDAAAEAQREARAVDANARYDQASATAWFANGLYAVGAVAAAVGVGCATVELTGVTE